MIGPRCKVGPEPIVMSLFCPYKWPKTPCKWVTGVITLIYIYNPTYRGYNSTYNWWQGPPCSNSISDLFGMVKLWPLKGCTGGAPPTRLHRGSRQNDWIGLWRNAQKQMTATSSATLVTTSSSLQCCHFLCCSFLHCCSKVVRDVPSFQKLGSSIFCEKNQQLELRIRTPMFI